MLRLLLFVVCALDDAELVVSCLFLCSHCYVSVWRFGLYVVCLVRVVVHVVAVCVCGRLFPV